MNTLERTYGSDFDLYLRSEYYNEYAGANEAHDNLYAFVADSEFGIAGLQFWHQHPTRRKFTDREVAVLGIVRPALRAGVQTHLRLSGQRSRTAERRDRGAALSEPAHGAQANSVYCGRWEFRRAATCGRSWS